jgi:protein TonB
MRIAVRVVLLATLSLAIVACSGETPPADSPTTAAAPVPASATTDPAPSDLAALDTGSLRQRATDALAANRLYAPAGDNAVEDYLALRERDPAETSVTIALADLAPYVIIGAEQATTAEAFPEAERLVELLARMDPEAPAVPRLREALAAKRAAADARTAAEQTAAEELAAEAQRQTAETQRRATAIPASAPAPSAPTPSTPPATVASAAATTPASARPTPPVAAAVRADDDPRPLPAAPRPSAPAGRTLLNRVSPRFPEAANRRRLEGEVEVAIRIRADGSVEAVDVVRADPPGVFDREAVLAVRRWRYAPAEAASEARVVLQFKRP